MSKGKQEIATSTNTARPNGKAWKKSWGPEGPPKDVVRDAVSQSKASRGTRA
jgi:hypothetical protein